ncbi:uro-adherence factor A-like [Mercenaria mercenaria]|uniref:uro-adherence factor A-like n=1 Tax=Mercenaria mercenaria TaxID=6596 RepID=UPI00234EA360|nr:uro-adherence factor A-like [Mercenaria mercenaria]XP_053400149.1 uro-adherence factor A-like [Mercenaria mercenaria]XP_053400152.1 uro-adherence factor A-like [Mercenaria mercenaria]XP_053400157.1 uro-adherence factor A-like [Mercenaria mercenaria]
MFMFTRFKKPNSATWTEVNDKLGQICPNFLALVDLILSIPASSADAERGFNRLKITKSDWRSCLSDSHLSDQLMIMLESPDVKDFDPLAAIHIWNSSAKRRVKDTIVKPVVSGHISQIVAVSHTDDSQSVPENISDHDSQSVPAENIPDGSQSVPAENITDGSQSVSAENNSDGYQSVPAENISDGSQSVPAENTSDGSQSVPADDSQSVSAENISDDSQSVSAENISDGSQSVPADDSQSVSAENISDDSQSLYDQNILNDEYLSDYQSDEDYESEYDSDIETYVPFIERKKNEITCFKKLYKLDSFMSRYN